MTSPQTDTARLTLALTELRLPAIKTLWPRFAEQAEQNRPIKKGGPPHACSAPWWNMNWPNVTVAGPFLRPLPVLFLML